MERNNTFAETLSKENESLYMANQVALYTDYKTSRDMIFKVCNFNKTLIDVVAKLEKRIEELEDKFEPEKKGSTYEIVFRHLKDNWVTLKAFADGCEYKIEAKVFLEPEEKYGLPISDYKISKFFVKDITNNNTVVMSDRGYLVGKENLENPLIKSFVKEVLAFFEDNFTENIED